MAGQPDLTDGTCVYCAEPIFYEISKYSTVGLWHSVTSYARTACYGNPRPWSPGMRFGRHVPTRQVPTFTTIEEAEKWLTDLAPN